MRYVDVRGRCPACGAEALHVMPGAGMVHCLAPKCPDSGAAHKLLSAKVGPPTKGPAYRLVVDRWPTPDGRPFTEQSDEFWEQVVDDYANGVGPAWLPADLSPYGEGALNPAKYTHWVGDPGEPDVGWSGSTTICVPIAPTRRFFTRATVIAMRNQLRQWGCTAHVEMAEIGDWQVFE